MAADIQTIRTLIGDRIKAAVNENVGQGDGNNRFFKFDMFPLVTNFTSHVVIFLTGTTAATTTYVLSGDVGRVSFNLGSEPADKATLLATYEYHAMSSGELSDILSGHTGNPYLAASNACLALAGDSSKLFMYTMGEKAVDKRKIATDLRELSKELLSRHDKMKGDTSYTAKVWTMKDDTGTVYADYDTAAAVYITTGI